MEEKIVSLTNKKIKDVVKLRERKHRNKMKLTIVEGHKEVLRALESKVDIKELYIYEEGIDKFGNYKIIDEVDRRNIPIYLTEKNVFDKIAYGDRNEGVIAICHHWDTGISNLSVKKNGLYIIAEGIEKPGNFGAILRTCDAVGVDGVIITEGNIDIFNPNVIRASLGAVFLIDIFTCSNREIQQFFGSNNIKICAMLPDAKELYTNINFNESIAIVVGCEHSGLTDFWKREADFKAKIPMQGKVDSLNVSSSTAIVLYEAIRQRRTK